MRHAPASTAAALLLASALAGADVPDHAARALEQVRAANVARATLETEAAAWAAERERLAAVRGAAEADAKALEAALAAATAEAEQAVAELRAIGQGEGDLAPVRTTLEASGRELRAALVALARLHPPGSVAIPASDDLEEALRALDVSERAALAVAVEVVSARLGAERIAVKALRVGGACAWWAALDGASAGTLAMVDGEAHATAVPAARDAIVGAIATAEGRHPAGVVALPADPAWKPAAGAAP